MEQLHPSERKGVNKKLISASSDYKRWSAGISKYLFMKIMSEYMCHNWETLNGVIPP